MASLKPHHYETDSARREREASQRAHPYSGRGVTAVLGPTNTGKTHLAIERMVAHPTGMIGLPLRLLAREVYTRLVERVGVGAVALVTGEEKIQPPNARYSVCTVEAMPRVTSVSFVAIDEVQLAGDLSRGHVFTDRILHLRGANETLLLGAATMRGILTKLLPGLNVVTRPRMSHLAYSGSKKITRLPRRSAIVAFSADEVYAIAELIRRQRGGAAVVLGALSPRTRNAQVELFQHGDVDFLVATDAIGMGLNLDLDHVAFAQDHKFDGFQTRPLSPAEMGQIAGRAGRHVRDGTFGVTGTVPPLENELVTRIESHDFEAVKTLQWRSATLDFSSVEALQHSVDAAPDIKGLARALPAHDVRALEILARDDAIRNLADTPRRVALLWEACALPDYRRIAPAQHAELIEAMFKDLARLGHVDETFMADQVSRADRTDGEIDTLSARIAQIRTWTFVSHRPNWLRDPAHWQGVTREVEDRLSDALHERLTKRFVDRRTSVLMRRLRENAVMEAEIGVDGDVQVEGHAVGTLEGFRFRPDASAGGADAKAVAAASARALGLEFEARAARLAASPVRDFALGTDGKLRWQGQIVAQLASGDDPLRPRVILLADEQLTGTARDKVAARLERHVRTQIETHLKPLLELTVEPSRLKSAPTPPAEPARSTDAVTADEAGGPAGGSEAAPPDGDARHQSEPVSEETSTAGEAASTPPRAMAASVEDDAVRSAPVDGGGMVPADGSEARSDGAAKAPDVPAASPRDPVPTIDPDGPAPGAELSPGAIDGPVAAGVAERVSPGRPVMADASHPVRTDGAAAEGALEPQPDGAATVPPDGAGGADSVLVADAPIEPPVMEGEDPTPVIMPAPADPGALDAPPAEARGLADAGATRGADVNEGTPGDDTAGAGAAIDSEGKGRKRRRRRRGKGGKEGSPDGSAEGATHVAGAPAERASPAPALAPQPVDDGALTGMARGLAFRLAEAFGVLPRRDVAEEVRSLDQAARAGLRRRGVRFGFYHIFVPALLKPGPAELVTLLWALKNDKLDAPGYGEVVPLLASGRTSVVVDPTFDREFYRLAGFRVMGGRAVRIDILERLADLIRPAVQWTPGKGKRPEAGYDGTRFVTTPGMMSILGAKEDDLTVILKALGYRSESVPASEVEAKLAEMGGSSPDGPEGVAVERKRKGRKGAVPARPNEEAGARPEARQQPSAAGAQDVSAASAEGSKEPSEGPPVEDGSLAAIASDAAASVGEAVDAAADTVMQAVTGMAEATLDALLPPAGAARGSAEGDHAGPSEAAPSEAADPLVGATGAEPAVGDRPEGQGGLGDRQADAQPNSDHPEVPAEETPMVLLWRQGPPPGARQRNRRDGEGRGRLDGQGRGDGRQEGRPNARGPRREGDGRPGRKRGEETRGELGEQRTRDDRRGGSEKRGPRRDDRAPQRDDRGPRRDDRGPHRDDRGPRRERQPDPDSPFAVLAALKGGKKK